MSILTKLFGRKKLKNATISLVGPSHSGKTTFIRYLETGEEVNQELNTTLGIEIRQKSVKIDSWEFTTIDTGGQELYQQTFWELAIQQSDILIFMIDATIKEDDPQYDIMKKQFEYALDITPEHIPVIVLLNKQDLKELNPMKPEDAINLLKDANVKLKTIAFLPISAKYGTGVNDAMKWIVKKLENR